MSGRLVDEAFDCESWMARLLRPAGGMLRTTSQAVLLSMFLLAPLAGLAKKEDFQSRLTPVPDDQQIPVADFFRPPMMTNLKLNPAGTHFAGLVSTQKTRIDLLTFELATKKVERMSAGDDFDVFDYDWLTDSRLIYYVGWAKRYASGVYVTRLGKLADAQALIQYSVVVPVGLPVANAAHAIVWIKNEMETRGADGGVFKIDTMNLGKPLPDGRPRLKQVTMYPGLPEGEAYYYGVDRLGELAFAFSIREGVRALHYLSDGKWVRSPIDLENVSVVTVGDAPRELIVCLSGDAEKAGSVFRMDAATGAVGETLFTDEKYDASAGRAYRSPADKKILGIRYHRKQMQTLWLDPSYADLQKLLEKTFPKETVSIVGSDREQKQFFVSVSSDVKPPTYYVFTLATSDVVRVVDTAPWIDPKRMRPMRTLTYQARDGIEIEAYLTLPSGASKERPAPLVVLPHGGPWVRDMWSWDGEVQFLASRGYAVLQPNYRGSTGYVAKYPAEDEWAFRKMHNDVTDGVRAVLKTGLVDGNRIAIMGASFGGYLALSGAAHEKDLYRCAITIAGVFDWEQMMAEQKSNEYRRGAYGLYHLKLGAPEKNRQKFEEISPLRFVSQIKIPVYVAHGTEDMVASVKQSKRLIQEFEKHQVTYEKQFEADEGHGFSELENNVELYTAVEAFLAKHMAPRPTAGTTEGAPIAGK